MTINSLENDGREDCGCDHLYCQILKSVMICIRQGISVEDGPTPREIIGCISKSYSDQKLAGTLDWNTLLANLIDFCQKNQSELVKKCPRDFYLIENGPLLSY